MKYDVNEPNDCKYCSIISAGVAALGSALIGGAASLIGGSQAAGAAKDAAGAQVEAARIAAELGREGLDFQKETFDVSRADLAPYRATGTGALQTMNNLFLPGGHPMVQLQGQLNDLRARRAVLARGGEQSTPVQPTDGATADADGSFLSNFEKSYRRQFTGEASDPLGIL